MDKVVEVQRQVKNNATDLNDYLRDLDNWTKQMENKDEQLKQAKKKKKLEENGQIQKSPVSTKVVKEEQNREIKKDASPPKKAKTETVKPQQVASTKSVKPRDYSEWDKFDVDAACDDVDQKSSDESDLEDEEDIGDEMKRVEAVAEKERGNDWFKKGDYDKAIERYTKGNDNDSKRIFSQILNILSTRYESGS